jgi:hypothetical protein
MPQRPPSRSRARAMAARARYQDGFSIHGDRIRQRCPYCWSFVYTAEPRRHRRGDHADLDRYSREVNARLDEAVYEHMRRDCPQIGDRRKS